MGKKTNYGYSPKQQLKADVRGYRRVADKEWNEAFFLGFECAMNCTMTILYECGEWKQEHLASYCEAMKDMLTSFNQNPTDTLEHIRQALTEADISVEWIDDVEKGVK